MLVVFSAFAVLGGEANAKHERGRLWLMYPAAHMRHEGARMINWWAGGWNNFSRKAVASHVRHAERGWGIDVHGIQIHHPWGRTLIDGKPKIMEFEQRARCIEEYRATGNKILGLALDDAAFLRAMEWISKRHELLVYVGSPHQMAPLPGETKKEWVARAKSQFGPVLEVTPRPLIGLDATFGQPKVDDPYFDLQFTGGPDGAVAMLVQDLSKSGHHVILEGAILFDAKWALELCGTLTTEHFWRFPASGASHSKRAWGRWAKLLVETKRPAIVKLDIEGNQWDSLIAVEKWLDQGVDVVVNPSSIPGYPWSD